MGDDRLICKRLEKMNILKSHLENIDKKLMSITEELNWDYAKLLEEDPLEMVICSVDNNHVVPQSKLSSHEKKCRWRLEGYTDDDKVFPDHSGSGSFVTFTPDLLKSITANVSLLSGKQEPPLRSVPQTSANFDQNFNREEKLAIYDYAIANTEKQKSFSDLCFLSFEKKEEEGDKKELQPWEIAAAERDAKRRRASYRNKKKVHTNRKTQTEILREVIEAQMEIFREQMADSRPPEIQQQQILSTTDKSEKDARDSDRRRRHDSRSSEDDSKHSYRETSSRRERHRGDHHKSRSHDRHSKRRKDRTRKRSPSFNESDSDSRSRSHDRFRKWKPHDGRSHSHKSREYFRRKEYDSRSSEEDSKHSNRETSSRRERHRDEVSSSDSDSDRPRRKKSHRDRKRHK